MEKLKTLLKVFSGQEKYAVPIYKNPIENNKIIKISTNEGIGFLKEASNESQDSVSIMSNSGVIRIEAIKQKTLVKENLLLYNHFSELGNKAERWKNSYGNTAYEATLRRVDVSGKYPTTIASGISSYVQSKVPIELISNVYPFTLEFNCSVAGFNVTIATGYNNQNPAFSYIQLREDRVAVRLVKIDNSENIESRFNLSGENINRANIFRTFSITYDGLYTVKLYIDGALMGTNTLSEKIYFNNGENFSYGDSSSISSSFKFFRIYNKELSLEEIEKNYSVGEEIGL